MSLPQLDDPAAADPARRRLLQKSSFPRFPSLPSRPSTIDILPPPDSDDATPPQDIHIDDAHLPHPNDNKDLYRWAILYENQRGITLFSTPFYSSLSLLPSDPQPFTIPHNRNPRAHQPNLSLDNYPLPDGTWRWVSPTWMIDMRTDLGEVQHDGFEYNWSFRQNNWHANIGNLSAGAWVRRRRWIRLMMRPANQSNVPSTDNQPPILSSPSLVPSTSKLSLVDVNHLWDGSEQDWRYVRGLLKHLGRDGRKLELWRTWLAPHAHTHDTKGKASLEKRLSDVVPEGDPPPLECLTTVLRNHGEAILHTFVFPDSRAQFVDLVRRTGLANDLETCLGHPFSSADVDFWSYANDLRRRWEMDRV